MTRFKLLFSLSCILNWFVQSYRPLSNLFSRSLRNKNGPVRALSNLLLTTPSISTNSKCSSNKKVGPFEFDPSSIFSWWLSDSPKSIHSNLDRSKAEKYKMVVETISPQKTIEQPLFVAGYMDFDPMVAAKKQHCGGRRHSHKGGHGGLFSF